MSLMKKVGSASGNLAGWSVGFGAELGLEVKKRRRSNHVRSGLDALSPLARRLVHPLVVVGRSFRRSRSRASHLAGERQFSGYSCHFGVLANWKQYSTASLR